MATRFGRDFDAPGDTAQFLMRPMRIFKWSHADEVFRAQKAHADADPFTTPNQPDTSADIFKLYEEAAASNGDGRELLIECKMVLRRLAYFGGVYELYLFPLRGTDVWAVIQAAAAVLGPPETMILTEPGITVYFAASETG